MNYFWGALAGAAWGTAAAFLNALIMKKSVKKNSSSAAVGGNTLRMFVDLIALAVVFLLRNVLPFSFEAALIATAVTMSIVSIIFTYKIAHS